MFSDIDKIFAISMGNHLESCKEDVIRLEILCRKLNANYEGVFNCNPQKDILNFIVNKNFSNKDLLIIHYSGHGKLVGKNINGKMEMISTWISNDMKTLNYSNDIDNILSNIKCKILLISDSCHSGRFADFYTGENLIFMGSSTVTNQSKEYSIDNKKKCGILINILEYIFVQISLQELTFPLLEEFIREFCIKNKIKIRPIVKLKCKT